MCNYHGITWQGVEAHSVLRPIQSVVGKMPRSPVGWMIYLWKTVVFHRFLITRSWLDDPPNEPNGSNLINML